MIPSFQNLMHPLLTLCNDGTNHTKQEIFDSLKKQFLVDEDKKFSSLVVWATNHLVKAKLLTREDKSFKITFSGKELSQKVNKIDFGLLKTIPEYNQATKKIK